MMITLNDYFSTINSDTTIRIFDKNNVEIQDEIFMGQFQYECRTWLNEKIIGIRLTKENDLVIHNIVIDLYN